KQASAFGNPLRRSAGQRQRNDRNFYPKRCANMAFSAVSWGNSRKYEKLPGLVGAYRKKPKALLNQSNCRINLLGRWSSSNARHQQHGCHCQSFKSMGTPLFCTYFTERFIDRQQDKPYL